VFVFLCKNPECHQQNSNVPFIVLRSQLPRVNDFYSSEPPTPSTPMPTKGDKRCVVCGIAGPKCCAKCHSRSYCSKEHQTIDWKGGHKQNCSETQGCFISLFRFTQPHRCRHLVMRSLIIYNIITTSITLMGPYLYIQDAR
jgi:hypothetical protein